MASKIDKVLDRLERLTDDVNNLKRKAIPLLPVPPLVKSALRTGTQRLDDVIILILLEELRMLYFLLRLHVQLLTTQTSLWLMMVKCSAVRLGAKRSLIGNQSKNLVK